MAYRIVNEIDVAESDRNVYIPKEGSGVKGGGDSVAGTAGTGIGTTRTGKMDDEEEREAVFLRLESLGYRVGQGLVER